MLRENVGEDVCEDVDESVSNVNRLVPTVKNQSTVKRLVSTLNSQRGESTLNCQRGESRGVSRVRSDSCQETRVDIE